MSTENIVLTENFLQKTFEYRQKIIIFLKNLAENKPEIKNICESLINVFEKFGTPGKLSADISHLKTIRHYLKIKEGKSAYDEENNLDFSQLIQAGLIILDNFKSPKVNPLINSGNAIFKEDNYSREQQCKNEQISYDSNPLFHNLLKEIWLYAIENGYASKTIFVSYAWPREDEHNEAWTKPFVEKMVEHLILSGFSVYLDEKFSGAGYPLDHFMEKIGKVDHILIISSRTMGNKLKIQNSGVSQENSKIKKYIGNNKLLIKERAIIPVLLNYQNYCDPEFLTLAEVPVCVDGYLKSLRTLIQRLYSMGDNFIKWFNNKLFEEKIAQMYHVPLLRPTIIHRNKLLYSKLETLFEKRDERTTYLNLPLSVIC